MPKITSVEPQKKNPKRFNIYLDGTFAFGADEDLVVEHRLVVGKIIPQENIEKLLFEAEVGKLMERMINIFSYRQRSEKEVRDYLKNLSFKRKMKGLEEVSEIATGFLIERLKKKGLLNDLEFAKAWVEARRKSKLKGKIALKSELFQKGIDKATIESVLEGEVDEEELAYQALKKKSNSWQNLDQLTFKKKAYEFLVRRGFNYSTISHVVAKFTGKR